jgi:hypothetical protein
MKLEKQIASIMVDVLKECKKSPLNKFENLHDLVSFRKIYATRIDIVDDQFGDYLGAGVYIFDFEKGFDDVGVKNYFNHAKEILEDFLKYENNVHYSC